MNSRKMMAVALSSTALTLVWGAVNVAQAVPCTTPYVTGDVFASVGNSTVDVFTPTGTPVCTLNDGSGSTFTTGSGFDSSGNFFVTNFGTETVSKFDNSGGLISSAFITSGNTPELIVNVSTGPFAGSSFVGGPGAATINQFNTSTGALIHSFAVAGGSTGGTDWLDFISPTTAIYDGEGYTIKSFNFQTSTQNADFATDPHYGYAMRVIPTGAFAGDVLRADSTQATLLSSTGAVLTNYTLPGDLGTDFALNLDPDGIDFWTADASSNNIWEVDIATGAIVEEFNCGSCELFGLAVAGELTTVNKPPPIPEPASLTLMATGLLGFRMLRRRRKAS